MAHEGAVLLHGLKCNYPAMPDDLYSLRHFTLWNLERTSCALKVEHINSVCLILCNVSESKRYLMTNTNVFLPKLKKLQNNFLRTSFSADN
jgi:hypothetical protein